MLRTILALVIVGAAVWTNFTYSPHHSTDNVFTTLYMHLIPAPLQQPSHGQGADEGHGGEHGSPDYLLTVPLPSFLGFMDVDGHTGADSEATGSHGDAHGAGEAGEEHHPRTALFNLQIFQLASLLLCFVCFTGIPRYVRTGQGDWITRTFAGFAMWIRDEMVYPVMGKELGFRYLPYFLALFFFIVFMNLMGLVPMTATPTASIFVTAGLALTTLVGMIFLGMKEQGPIGFWKNLVPHVPLALWPLMFIVEVLGLFVKPFALMIRLFANMSGGHMVVLSFMGLIFYFASVWGVGGGWGASPMGVGFAVFIMIIEVFVALLQAYIFTQLTIMFFNQSLHPEH